MSKSQEQKKSILRKGRLGRKLLIFSLVFNSLLIFFDFYLRSLDAKLQRKYREVNYLMRNIDTVETKKRELIELIADLNQLYLLRKAVEENLKQEDIAKLIENEKDLKQRIFINARLIFKGTYAVSSSDVVSDEKLSEMIAGLSFDQIIEKANEYEPKIQQYAQGISDGKNRLEDETRLLTHTRLILQIINTVLLLGGTIFLYSYENERNRYDK